MQRVISFYATSAFMYFYARLYGCNPRYEEVVCPTKHNFKLNENILQGITIVLPCLICSILCTLFINF